MRWRRWAQDATGGEGAGACGAGAWELEVQGWGDALEVHAGR
ncbi:hypothetical protein [Kribbella pittospori]|nr:hypothetical protein [Kribbella pittospori]